MDYTIEAVAKEDGKAVIDIFNYYVQKSFAAYPDEAVPYEFFQFFLNMAEGYPFLVAKDRKGRVLGFAWLRPHSSIPVFSRTAEITAFLAQDCTRKGLGRALEERLLDAARQKGLSSILAGISSLNSASLAFHRKCGFVECGRFPGVGRKWGQDFDVVWMQKRI